MLRIILFISLILVMFRTPETGASKKTNFRVMAESQLGLKVKRFPFNFLGQTYVSETPQNIMLSYQEKALAPDIAISSFKPADMLSVRSLHQQTTLAFFKFTAEKQKQLQFIKTPTRLIASYETQYLNESREKRYLLECIHFSKIQKYVSMTSSVQFPQSLHSKFGQLCKNL